MNNTRSPFRTIDEIKSAVRNGEKIYWKSDNYEVRWHRFPSGEEQWLVTCTLNDHSVGLTHADGVKSEYDPRDFYFIL